MILTRSGHLLIESGEISWESIIEDVQMVDPSFGDEMGEFYEDCLRFNGA
jgi:hypothetical protein